MIGHWWPYELATELIAGMTLLGVGTLIGIRLANLPSRVGRTSRFAGSTFWQAYYVEYTIVTIAVCVLALRGLEGALEGPDHYASTTR